MFLQRSAVNLLSSVLDTPEFFWSVADNLQVLYERACEYLELEVSSNCLGGKGRVEVDHLRQLVQLCLLQH